MNERSIELKVGILVLLCVGLLVGFVLLLGDVTTGSRDTLLLDVPTSAELKPGAPVKVSGVPAGSVDDVRYMGGEMDASLGRRVYVRVTLLIDPRVRATLHDDAKFYITTQGMLGERYVEVEPGSPEAPVLAPGAVVLGMPPVRLEVVAANLDRLLAVLADMVGGQREGLDSLVRDSHAAVLAMRRAAERTDALLARSAPQAEEAIKAFVELERKAGAVLDSTQAILGDGTEVRETIANLSALSQEAQGELKPLFSKAKDALEQYAGLADTAQRAMGTAQEAANQILASAQLAMGNILHLTEQAQSPESTVGALLQDKEMVDDMRELMRDVKRHPWKFLWKE